MKSVYEDPHYRLEFIDSVSKDNQAVYTLEGTIELFLERFAKEMPKEELLKYYFISKREINKRKIKFYLEKHDFILDKNS